jgi:hypothetical protein
MPSLSSSKLVVAMAPAADNPAVTVESLLTFDAAKASSADIAGAIQLAKLRSADLATTIAKAGDDRPALLLRASDEEVIAQDREVARAQRDQERLSALVLTLTKALAAQQGAEALEDLRRLGEEAQQAHDALSKWQRGAYEKLRTAIAEGLQLEAEALSKRSIFEAATAEAYQRSEVREAGPVGMSLPPLADNLPSLVFPNWGMPA